MIRLNTEQMKKRLSESYSFIYALEQESEKDTKEENDDRRKSS